jgi:hypothetical protein
MNIKTLHEAISAELQQKVPALRSILCYPSGRAILEAPVGILEISQIRVGVDPGTEELSIVFTWTLRIVIDSTIENANIALQSLIIDVAKSLHFNNFGLKMTPAEFVEIRYEADSDAEALLVGAVLWQNELHVGESEWDVADFVSPHSCEINFVENQ